MIRSFKCLLIFSLILSCNEHHSKSNKNDNNVKNKPNEDSAFTELHVMDSLKLPTGFYLDTIYKFDKKRNAEIQIILPNSIAKTNYDSEITIYFKKKVHEFIVSQDQINGNSSMSNSMQSSFVVRPICVYKDLNLLSYCFLISNDLGMAHPVDEYYSFNFDLKKKKRIFFFDLFKFKSKSDSVFLFSNIRDAIYKANPDVDKEFIEFRKLYNIDFNVEQDSISFNFDDYEIGDYGLGIIRAKVSKKKLAGITVD